MRRRLTTLRAGCVLALASVMAACEGSSSDPVAPRIESATFASALAVDLSASTKTSSGLYYRDLVVGSGTAVVRGNQLVVKYTGWLSNGTQFDSNQTAAGFGFTIGSGLVINGWEEGLIGAKVGGRRQLIIPPSLGYGASANGSIPGNSILVFNVDIVSAK